MSLTQVIIPIPPRTPAQIAEIIKHLTRVRKISNIVGHATNPEKIIPINERIAAMLVIEEKAKTRQLRKEHFGQIFQLVLNNDNFPISGNHTPKDNKQNNALLRSIAAYVIAKYGLQNQTNKNSRQELTKEIKSILELLTEDEDLEGFQPPIHYFLAALILLDDKHDAAIIMGNHGISDTQIAPLLANKPLRRAS